MRQVFIASIIMASSVALSATRDGNPRTWHVRKDYSNAHKKQVVEYQICLLEAKDTIKANRLSNALNLGNEIPLLDSDFKKTSRLILRYHSSSKNVSYKIDPAPIKTEADPQKNEVHYHFDNTHMVHGIPFVNVSATMEIGPTINPHEILKNRDYALKKTDNWPVGSLEIRNVLSNIELNENNELTKLESILNWLKSESGIRIGVEPKGQRATRHGVKHTLKEMHGNCWDYSDLFITLCRTAALPSRQIAGWQKDAGGHIWAEVYIMNMGWIQVNPTRGKTIGDDYAPLFTTSDGQLSCVYRSFPKINSLVEKE